MWGPKSFSLVTLNKAISIYIHTQRLCMQCFLDVDECIHSDPQTWSHTHKFLPQQNIAFDWCCLLAMHAQFRVGFAFFSWGGPLNVANGARVTTHGPQLGGFWIVKCVNRGLLWLTCLQKIFTSYFLHRLLMMFVSSSFQAMLNLVETCWNSGFWSALYLGFIPGTSLWRCHKPCRWEAGFACCEEGCIQNGHRLQIAVIVFLVQPKRESCLEKMKQTDKIRLQMLHLCRLQIIAVGTAWPCGLAITLDSSIARPEESQTQKKHSNKIKLIKQVLPASSGIFRANSRGDSWLLGLFRLSQSPSFQRPGLCIRRVTHWRCYALFECFKSISCARKIPWHRLQLCSSRRLSMFDVLDCKLSVLFVQGTFAARAVQLCNYQIIVYMMIYVVCPFQICWMFMVAQ